MCMYPYEAVMNAVWKKNHGVNECMTGRGQLGKAVAAFFEW